MDDGWAVVVGAAIALVASIVGGFMSSVVGPLIARRGEAKQRAQAASNDRMKTLQQTILEASLSLRAYALARIMEDWEGVHRELLAVENHMIRLRLWTTHAEAEIADRLMHALSMEDAAQTAAAAWTWERLAAQWFRGTLSNEDFAAQYDLARAGRLPTEQAFVAMRDEEIQGRGGMPG